MQWAMHHRLVDDHAVVLEDLNQVWLLVVIVIGLTY